MSQLYKTSFFKRAYDKRKEASQEVLRKNKELTAMRYEINQTILTKGWKEICKGVESSIEALKNQVIDTSSWRVFKCAELKADIKSLQKLYKAMKTEELAGLLRKQARE